MASSVSELLSSIIAKILSGGRRTTADNTRQILSDITTSNLNLTDGGVVNGPTTFNSDVIIPDDQGENMWKIKISDQGEVYGEKI